MGYIIREPGVEKGTHESMEGYWKFPEISENICIYCMKTGIHILCKPLVYIYVYDIVTHRYEYDLGHYGVSLFYLNFSISILWKVSLSLSLSLS